MSFRIASWNIEGRLSNLAVTKRGTPEHILQNLAALEADVAFLPEAFADEILDEWVAKRIDELGYSYKSVPYQEGGPVRVNSAVHHPSMLLLSKLPIVACERIRLGDLRNALVATVNDLVDGRPVRIIGVHLDDRSEALRLQQVPDVVRVVRASPLPTVVLGDFNAMHGRSAAARLARTRMIRWLGVTFVPSLANRVVDMAAGETLLAITKKTSLQDADPQCHPTTTPKMRTHEWMPSIRLIQIDHILCSSGVMATDFRIAGDGGSDHRAISATITIDKSS